MVREVKGRYSGGVVLPLEQLDLAEGAEVVIAVSDGPEAAPELADDPAEAARKRNLFLSSFGGWKDMHDPDEFASDDLCGSTDWVPPGVARREISH